MNSFVINHKRYDVGTTFQITTPELGTVMAPVETVQQMATVGAVGLRLGPITTPLACRSSQHPQHNAWLQFYALGDYLRLQLIYTCSCPYEYHNHSLEWDVLLNETTIVATKIGSYFRQPHNHPMAVGFEELAQPAYVVPDPPAMIPKPIVQSRREIDLPATARNEPTPQPKPKKPDPSSNRHDQFSLF